jgi:hypothetical protein
LYILYYQHWKGWYKWLKATGGIHFGSFLREEEELVLYAKEQELSYSIPQLNPMGRSLQFVKYAGMQNKTE